MSQFAVITLIFLGGGLGSVCRFGVGKFAAVFYEGKFPLGTLITNTLACALVGLTIFMLKDKTAGIEWVKYFVIIGFCGGFSTFSAFGFETVNLLKDGLIAYALINILLSLLLGIVILFMLLR